MSYSETTNEPSPDEEAASLAGLALAPWVAARAAEIKAANIAEMAAQTDDAVRQRLWRRKTAGRVA